MKLIRRAFRLLPQLLDYLESIEKYSGHMASLQVLKLSGRAKEIEKEWQKIQQDEHNAVFANQVFNGRNGEEVAYRKGIVEGIKWCVDRFS